VIRSSGSKQAVRTIQAIEIKRVKLFSPTTARDRCGAGFYSLPQDMRRGECGCFLKDRGAVFNVLIVRVFETLQMVVDVMSPGGLAAGRGSLRH